MSHAAAQTASKKESGVFASIEKQTLIVSLLLFVTVLVLYNPTMSHPFANVDDDRYVTDNLHVRQGLTGDTIAWAITSTDDANWHPLTWMSHALDFQLFRLNPAGHHFTSVLLHGVNVVLLYLLLAWSTRKMVPSLFVALLFAVHPLNVESVAWIAERKNVLCTLFFFLALGAYIWYASKPNWRRYLLVTACYACALASKPMAITFPCVLILFDYWPLGRVRGSASASTGKGIPQESITGLVIEKLPFLLMSVASAVITVIAQQSGGGMRSTQQFPLSVRMGNAVYAYAMYVWKAVWPAHLAALYPHPGNGLKADVIIIAAFALLTITAVCVVLRSHAYLLMGWLWFLGTLVPVIGLVQVGDQAMADRYAYIPLIGLFVMIAFGVAELAQPTTSETPPFTKRHDIRRRLGAGAGLLAVGVLAVACHHQIDYWQSNESLWRHTLAVTERNYIAEDSLGGALLSEGRTEEALTHFYKAAEINPHDPMSRMNIGAYLVLQGKFRPAIDELHQVIALTSDSGLLANAYANLGMAYRGSSDVAEARHCYEEALRLNPYQSNAWLGQGLVLEDEGDWQGAVTNFDRSTQIQPSPQGFLLLGRALERLGRHSEARSAFESALKLQPDLPEAQTELNSMQAK